MNALFQSRNHNSSVLSQVALSFIARCKNGAPFIAAYNKLLVVTTASILTIIAVCVWSMYTLYADTIYHQLVFFIVYGSVVTNKL